jgi:hypothetical protein
MTVYSVTSLVGRGTTLQMQLLIWACMSSVMSKSALRQNDTKFMFWKWLCWNFDQLKEGVVAEYRPNNTSQPDAGCSLFGDSGYRSILFITAADLDEYHKASYMTLCI